MVDDIVRARLLIADQRQFGYLTDTYNYCRNISRNFEITYVCWDYGLKKVELTGVRVLYVSRQGGRIRRWLAYFACLRDEIRHRRHDLAHIVYFRGCCALWWVVRGKPVNLDIRTGSVQRNSTVRALNNLLLRIEAYGFRKISIVSQSLMRSLKLNPAKCTIIPLGANPLEIARDGNCGTRLLYVGTLQDRDIYKTVYGFDAVRSESRPEVEMVYNIVGDGPPEDKARLLAAIEECGSKGFIRYHGRVPHSEIAPLLGRANVGVAFVPIVEWYQCQPTTKVFEYLLAGMVVIATDTIENRRVITPENGVLIEDSSEGFATGLRDIVRRLPQYKPEEIRRAQLESSWESIVSNIVLPYFLRVLEEPRLG